MTESELAQGYGWLYRRLFSHASIWHRRPDHWRAVAPYLAMSYLHKRSNRVWHFLKHGLVSTVWRPLVELTRQRHLKFRRDLALKRAARGDSGRVAGSIGDRLDINPLLAPGARSIGADLAKSGFRV